MLQPEPMERALETIELYAHFCRATGIDDDPCRRDLGDPRRVATATSSWRGARALGLESRCCSREEEARYGYLAAVNSTTLTDGVALDIGGGSMQLTLVERPARGATCARGRSAPCA